MSAREYPDHLVVKSLTLDAEPDSNQNEPVLLTAEAFGVISVRATTDELAIPRAIAKAAELAAATGERQTVKLSAGAYEIHRSGLNSFDLDGVENVTICGAEGGLTVIRMVGSVGGMNWRLFNLTNCHGVVFDGLTLEAQGLTDLDEVADQVHLLQLNSGCYDITIRHCKFRNFYQNGLGDAIRLLGDRNQGWVEHVMVHSCEFEDIFRSAISFQRFCRHVSVMDCRFTGQVQGQWIDFEPTGWILTADGGSDSNTLVDAAYQFNGPAGVEVGTSIRNITENVWSRVTAINSQNSVETVAVTNWAGDDYAVPCNNYHRITCNHFDNTEGDVEACVTLTGSFWVDFSHNTIVNGTVDAFRAFFTTIAFNTITSGRRGSSNACVDISSGADSCTVAFNTLTVRNDAEDNQRDGIRIMYDETFTPGNMLVQGNRVRMECQGVGIEVQGCKSVSLVDNTVVKAEPSVAVSGVVGLRVNTTVATADHVRVCNNTLLLDHTAAGGRWLCGLQLTPSTHNVTQAIVTGNDFELATTGVDMSGTADFTRPPFVTCNVLASNSNSALVMPTTAWIQLGGNAQAGPGNTSFAPADYWGDGVPAFAAPDGSTARRRDGAAGSLFYVMIDGTWTAVH